jgi:hypothetical protein
MSITVGNPSRDYFLYLDHSMTRKISIHVEESLFEEPPRVLRGRRVIIDQEKKLEARPEQPESLNNVDENSKS